MGWEDRGSNPQTRLKVNHEQGTFNSFQVSGKQNVKDALCFC